MPLSLPPFFTVKKRTSSLCITYSSLFAEFVIGIVRRAVSPLVNLIVPLSFMYNMRSAPFLKMIETG
nr:MAG TPA: hypothetical protein [Caudoviricetes sp.]